MTSLTPNGLVIWTNSDSQSLAAASAAMMNSVDNHIKNKAINTYKWATSTARAAQTGMSDGDLGVQIDTDTLWMYTALKWEILVAPPDSYPLAFNNLTVGNGEVQASFSLAGNRVFVDGSIRFGSTTAVTGAVMVSLPVEESSFYKSNGSQKYVGGCQLLNVGIEGVPGMVYINQTSPGFAQLQRLAVSGGTPGGNVQQYSVNVNTPFKWESGDIMSWSFNYQRTM